MKITFSGIIETETAEEEEVFNVIQQHLLEHFQKFKFSISGKNKSIYYPDENNN